MAAGGVATVSPVGLRKAQLFLPPAPRGRAFSLRAQLLGWRRLAPGTWNRPTSDDFLRVHGHPFSLRSSQERHNPDGASLNVPRSLWRSSFQNLVGLIPSTGCPRQPQQGKQIWTQFGGTILPPSLMGRAEESPTGPRGRVGPLSLATFL